MCPACISMLAILVAGAVSSGGVTALVVSKFRAMSGNSSAESSMESTNQKEEAWEQQRTSK
jgi:hypothetical protein